MNDHSNSPQELKALIDRLMPRLIETYQDLHAHPELSLMEMNTAQKMADQLKTSGYEVITGVGKTGVVGILRNGPGPVVMLRADMDALPVREETGIPYASQVTTSDRKGKQVAVMHACGHDIHMTCLAGASMLLSETKGSWQGTVVSVFQPAEETSEGAVRMVRDGLYDRIPKPDVILGQHVINIPVGSINWSFGAATTTGDSLQIRLIGRGSHGAMPENSIDPVVMAASLVLRLQTVVSREVPANEAVVITIGSIQAGTMENVIPEEAILKVNVRTYDEKVRQNVLSAIKRIVDAEASASGAVIPPEITTINHFSMVKNDRDATKKVVNAFEMYFPKDQVRESYPTRMSDDFGEFNLEGKIPSVYWFIGSTPHDVFNDYQSRNKLADLPTNHNPKFAPLIPATIENGVEALVIGALAWLSI